MTISSEKDARFKPIRVAKLEAENSLLSQLSSRLLPSLMAASREYEPIIELKSARAPTMDDSLVDRDPARAAGDVNNDWEYQRALAEWKSVSNVDAMLEQIYRYYQGKGMYFLLMTNVANLAIMLTVVFLSVTLKYCIDYERLRSFEGTLRLWTLFSPLGIFAMPLAGWVALAAFMAYAGWQLQCLLYDSIPQWLRLRRFFRHLAEIPDADLPTTAFSRVEEGIRRLQERHPISADRLDALDIATRVMRRHNYLVALVNERVLFPHDGLAPPLTFILEWNLTRCIFNHFFDDRLQPSRAFLQSDRFHKQRLVDDLQRRFVIAGVANLLLMPLIAIFTCLYFVYRYGEEVYRHPHSIVQRQYTPMAQWNLRHYNELPHFFNKRLAMSYRKASKYLDQFPSDWNVLWARTASFFLGSAVIVLIGLSLLRPDALLHALLLDRNILWWIGVLSGGLALCRAAIPDPNRSDDPARLMTAVIAHTHYCPPEWKGAFHSAATHRRFSAMFPYKAMILARELLGIVAWNWVALCWLMPRRAKAIVDFFRESTVHVDGVGYLCSQAVFTVKGGEEGQKMHQSVAAFHRNHPQWQPAEAAVESSNVDNCTDGDSHADTAAALADLDNVRMDDVAPGFQRQYTSTLYEECDDDHDAYDGAAYDGAAYDGAAYDGNAYDGNAYDGDATLIFQPVRYHPNKNDDDSSSSDG